MSDISPEELNKLVVRLFGRFLLLMTLKWVLIFGVTRALRKYIESLPERKQ